MDGIGITDHIGRCILSDDYTELLEMIYQQREIILRAFIAETGLKPSECEQVWEQHREGGRLRSIWYIRKREEKEYDPLEGMN